MTVPESVSTIAPAGDEDDQPQFPPNLFQSSTWSLQDLKHLQEIGKGKDTIIYSATCPRLGGRIAAVKVYDRAKVAPTKLRAIKREIAMMMFFHRKKVPNVVEFYEAFQDENYYYIVMEYCPGGDLLEYLLRDRKAMSERRCAVDVARPLLATIARLHELNVIHRDIKLENIFLDSAGRVRLGDFGLTMSQRQEAAISPVGTVEYMAPEVVVLPSVDMVTSGRIRASTIQPTDEKVDIWALGVTLYELVTGRLPFEGRDKAEIKAAITEYNLAPFPLYVSTECHSMICSMLAYNKELRPPAAELLKHAYLQKYANRTGGGGGPTVTLEVRAGPPPSTDAASSTYIPGRSQVASSYTGTGTSPGPSFTGFQKLGEMSASSREVSASNLVRSSSPSSYSNGSSSTAALKAGTNAWAALRRLSGGQGQGKSGVASVSEIDGVNKQHSVKGAVKRLFSRQSAPHRVQGGVKEYAM